MNRKARLLLQVMLAVIFVFSFAGQGLAAADHVETRWTEDGRVQLVFEFEDLESAQWAKQHITRMQAKNIFKGYTDGTFRPNKPVTRVEAIATAVRLLGLEEEARERSTEDLQLHFKDAKLIERHYAWAKGYIVVALENGLFDSTEDKIQPDKPATRLWVASLIVRALGLEEEALKSMTQIPGFRDAGQIPAAAIGYVNVAVKYELIKGFPNNTFRPHQSITRAQMAALLDRAEDLRNKDAIVVTGEVINIQFDTGELPSVAQAVYEDVYDGSITIRQDSGEISSYPISSKLPVEYHGRYISADQIYIGDIVKLLVKNGVVIEAAILQGAPAPGEPGDGGDEGIENIDEFVLKVHFGRGKDLEIKYRRGGKKNDDDDIAWIRGLGLTSDMSDADILGAVLGNLDPGDRTIEKLELKIKFSDGKKVNIVLDRGKGKGKGKGK